MKLLLWVIAAAAYGESFDVITFEPPRGWKRQQNDELVGYTRVSGREFCLIAVMRSVDGAGDARRDFDADWQKLVARRFRVLDAPRPETLDAGAGWRQVTGSANVSDDNSGRFWVTLHTYSRGARTANIQFNANSDECRAPFRAFLQSVRLTDAGAAPPAAPPVSSTEGEWRAAITADGVEYTRGPVRVYQFYPLPLDDSLRQGEMALNIWTRFAATRYRVLSQQAAREEAFAIKRWHVVSGALADGANSRYFGTITTSVENGIAQPVLAVGPDEASVRSLFPTPAALQDMQRRNAFAVSRGDLAGRWTSNFASAAANYFVATGAFAWLSIASASMDLQLNADGSFTRLEKAVTGRVGAIRSGSEQTVGRYELSGSALTLRDNAGKVTTYDCVFVAVRGGLALRLANRQFSGDRWDLVRAR